MLKHILSLFAFLLFISAIYAQTADPRLRTVYSEDYLNDIAQNHPNELKFLNWSLDNSFTIMELGIEKCEHLPYLQYFDPTTKTSCGNVESIYIESFNIYMYSFERKFDRQSSYRIGSTGYAIIFESEKKLAENYNLYQYGK